MWVGHSCPTPLTLILPYSDFDLDSDSDVDFDSNREGHGLSRAAKDPPNSPRLQPLRDAAIARKARVGRTQLSAAVDSDFDFAHVGRTLLSDAFDVDFDFDSDFGLDREGRGLSRAKKNPPKSPRLQPPRAAAPTVPNAQ